MRLYGEGNYAISAVKDIKVTEDFLKLDEIVKNCQNYRKFEECETNKYLDIVEKKCKCIPYKLRDFTKNQVDF